MVPECILEGLVEGIVKGDVRSYQQKLEGGASGKVMALLPISQSVSPEAPKFRSARCDLEPVVANEEEVV